MTVKDNEKFISFCLLGAAIVGLTCFAMLHTVPDSAQGTQRMLDGVMGALTLAFGGAANALFRITDTVKVANPPSNPVNTTEQPAPGKTAEAPVEELPDYAK
jgi:hypothetical protein